MLAMRNRSAGSNLLQSQAADARRRGFSTMQNRRSGAREEAVKDLEATLRKGRARRAGGGWSVEKRTKLACLQYGGKGFIRAAGRKKARRGNGRTGAYHRERDVRGGRGVGEGCEQIGKKTVERATRGLEWNWESRSREIGSGHSGGVERRLETDVAGLIAAAATDDGATQCQATRRAKVGAHIEKAALGESELLGGLRRSGGACDYGNPRISDLLRREHVWRTRASGTSGRVGRAV
ncbi:hypothetical protein B0H14DRAFT_3175577 [Mycena olivaceomarginata]|nr:hypothetical protein B0H14DRAFT_3175577 [Mycena olivaceomarginata]